MSHASPSAHTSNLVTSKVLFRHPATPAAASAVSSLHLRRLLPSPALRVAHVTPAHHLAAAKLARAPAILRLASSRHTAPTHDLCPHLRAAGCHPRVPCHACPSLTASHFSVMTAGKVRSLQRKNAILQKLVAKKTLQKRRKDMRSQIHSKRVHITHG